MKFKLNKSTRSISIFIIALICTVYASAYTNSTKFNDNWRFLHGDVADAKNPDFNDSGWSCVSLPHDWSIVLPFDQNAPSGNDGGYLPTGIGWYRNTLRVPKTQLDIKRKLYFEGIYMNSEVYVNGQFAGGHPYGYSSFYVDLTPYLKEGNNSIAIKVDNSKQKNCRWFSGSGIYRNIWLKESRETHIADWGVHIVTPTLHDAEVEITLQNESSSPKTLEVSTSIVGEMKTTVVSIKPHEEINVKQDFNIPDAKAWSPDQPNLYVAMVEVKEDGKVIDAAKEKFGFRTIAWSAEDGFKLNGAPILLNGSCVHHDNGILGAAAYDRAECKRVEQLKEAGFNAVRTSHNPPSETFLNACDSLGLMVIDEAFDGWRDAKNEFDYHSIFDTHWQKDLDAMLLRDRNHPSVICWSIGNEVIERDKIEVVTTARKLTKRCHDLDPARPVTSALANWGKVWETYDPLAEQHDIVGYNYTIHESETDHQRDPDRVMWQTESYPKDAWSNYRKVADHPYIIGDFVWTGMDYIGESGIGRWYYDGDVPGEHYERPLFPWHASYCGDIDLTGLRKPISHYRSMLWNKDDEHLYMAVREPDNYNGKIQTTLWGTWPTFESWNWPGHEGKNIEVEVYSHYPEVKLYLNDKLIGEKKVEEMKAVFTLPYQVGSLRAEGIKDGYVEETVSLKTADKVAGIKVTPDRSTITADKSDLSYIVIEMVDEAGNVVPTADNQLEVTVGCNATLQALGNADIKDNDPYFDNTHKVWKGRALAVVRSNGKKGTATIKVTSPGLTPAITRLSIK